MKSSTALISALAFLAISSLASAAGGRDAGNGGAGVVQNGRYMTFYTAGIYTHPEPETEAKIPNLDRLLSSINGMAYLSPFSKAQILNALIPSPQHSYFAVDANKFDAATQARILAEFQRVTNVPTQNLELFAVTDTNARQTFLLPSFYKLSANDQMAILFHEAFWLMNPNTTYANVVAAEMSLEAVLENPNDGARILEFLKYAGSPGDQILYSVQADMASGALKGFVDDNNQFKFVALFGQDFISCLQSQSDQASTGAVFYQCQMYWSTNLYNLTQKYPQSLFIKALQADPTPCGDISINGFSICSPTALTGLFPDSLIVDFSASSEAGTTPDVYLPFLSKNGDTSGQISFMPPQFD